MESRRMRERTREFFLLLSEMSASVLVVKGWLLRGICQVCGVIVVIADTFATCSNHLKEATPP